MRNHLLAARHISQALWLDYFDSLPFGEGARVYSPEAHILLPRDMPTPTPAQPVFYTTNCHRHSVAVKLGLNY